jgi:hypothetical protein
VHKLLGFSVMTPNLGTADLDFGDPSQNPAFVYSPCHMHYHLRGYAQYRLLDASGSVVVTGRKQAFCLIDLELLSGTRQPRFNCDNQGITVGWADLYSNGLSCQYLDVTNVAPGEYTLEVTINPERLFPELDYSNNTTTTRVTIGPPGDPLAPCSNIGLGELRDCGWTDGPTFTCVAGSQVTVGCSADCGVGSCTGDTVLRVCAGDRACLSTAALVSNDECGAVGNHCSAATFTCPATGRYHVMTGPYQTDQGATCNLAHTP